MRIVFLSSLYPPRTRGGGEISTHLIARALVTLGDEVIVLTQGERRATKELDGVRIIQLPLPMTAKPMLERRHAKRMARQLQLELTKISEESGVIDIVQAHDFRTAQFLAELDFPRAVVTVRDYAQICGSPNNLLADGTSCPGCSKLAVVLRNQAVVEVSGLRKLGRVWQYRYNFNYRLSSFRAIKHQVYISRAQLAEISKVQNLQGITTQVIYNPVGQSYLAARPTTPRGQTILYVGRVQHYKGITLLLEAFTKLSRHNREVHLQVVGEGDGLAAAEAWVARAGLQYRVTFIGQITHDRLLRIYDDAAVVVAPHLWVEPFGRTVVEAMARERVVVAAKHGGPGEIIEDGKTGLLFEGGSVLALHDRLQAAVAMSELERRGMTLAARRWVMANLSEAIIGKQYQEWYSKLLL